MFSGVLECRPWRIPAISSSFSAAVATSTWQDKDPAVDIPSRHLLSPYFPLPYSLEFPFHGLSFPASNPTSSHLTFNTNERERYYPDYVKIFKI